MSRVKGLVALAVLASMLGIAVPAQAAKTNAAAARAECFRQANEAAANVGFSANTADRNAVGQDAYRKCCFKAGIRP